MNHPNEPLPTDPLLSNSLFLGMQVSAERDLACKTCRCHDFAPGYRVAPEPTDITAEDMSLILDMDWSNLRDLICADLVSVFRN